MSMIHPGDLITVETATGPQRKRATTGVVPGHHFEVVWAARPEEWEAAQAEGRDPLGVPWPAEDVTKLANETADEPS